MPENELKIEYELAEGGMERAVFEERVGNGRWVLVLEHKEGPEDVFSPRTQHELDGKPKLSGGEFALEVDDGS